MSQGIESTIEPIADTPGWQLSVSPESHEAALDAIQQYLRENRSWRWQQPLPWPGLLFDWASLSWALVAILFHWLSTSKALPLRAAGLMDNQALASGEWWRLFTAIWLHGDVGHLMSNVVFGTILLALAMGRFGTGIGLLAAYLAGAGGNLLALFTYDATHRALGASGMVMGALGLLTTHSLRLLSKARHPLHKIIGGIFAGIMLFVLLGLSPGTDIVAHLGGFVSGMILGSLLAFAPANILRNGTLQVVFGIVLAALILIPWWLAAHAKVG